MSKEDLAKSLEAIEDDAIRQKVAAGDLAAAGDLELTEEEAALLESAAADPDYPEVAGFAYDIDIKIEHIDHEPQPSSNPMESISFNFGKIE